MSLKELFFGSRKESGLNLQFKEFFSSIEGSKKDVVDAEAIPAAERVEVRKSVRLEDYERAEAAELELAKQRIQRERSQEAQRKTTDLVAKLKIYHTSQDHFIKKNQLELYYNASTDTRFASNEGVYPLDTLFNGVSPDSEEYFILCSIVLLSSQNINTKKKMLTNIMLVLNGVDETTGYKDKTLQAISQKLKYIPALFSLAFDATSPTIQQEFSELLIEQLTIIQQFYGKLEAQTKKLPLKSFSAMIARFEITSIIHKIAGTEPNDNYQNLFLNIIRYALNLLFGKKEKDLKEDANYKIFAEVSLPNNELRLVKEILDNPKTIPQIQSYEALEFATVAKILADQSKKPTLPQADKKATKRQYAIQALNLYVNAISKGNNFYSALESEFIGFCFELSQIEGYEQEIAAALHMLSSKFENSITAAFTGYLEAENDEIKQLLWGMRYKNPANKVNPREEARLLQAAIRSLEDGPEKDAKIQEIARLEQQADERDVKDRLRSKITETPGYSQKTSENYLELSRIIASKASLASSIKVKNEYLLMQLNLLRKARLFYKEMLTKVSTKIQKENLKLETKELYTSINDELKALIDNLLKDPKVDKKEIYTILRNDLEPTKLDITDPLIETFLDICEQYNKDTYYDTLLTTAFRIPLNVVWRDEKITSYFSAIDKRIEKHLQEDSDNLITKDPELKKLWIALIRDRSDEQNYLNLAKFYKNTSLLKAYDLKNAYGTCKALLAWITDISNNSAVTTDNPLGNSEAQFLTYQLHSEDGKYGLTISNKDNEHHYLTMAAADFSIDSVGNIARTELIQGLSKEQNNLLQSIQTLAKQLGARDKNINLWQLLTADLQNFDNLYVLAQYYENNHQKIKSGLSIAKNLYALLKDELSQGHKLYSKVKSKSQLLDSISTELNSKTEINLLDKLNQYYKNQKLLQAWKIVNSTNDITEVTNNLNYLADIYSKVDKITSIRLRQNSIARYSEAGKDALNNLQRLAYAKTAIKLAEQYFNTPKITVSAEQTICQLNIAANILLKLECDTFKAKEEQSKLIEQANSLLFKTYFSIFNQINFAELKELYNPILAGTQRDQIVKNLKMKTKRSIELLENLQKNHSIIELSNISDNDIQSVLDFNVDLMKKLDEYVNTKIVLDFGTIIAKLFVGNTIITHPSAQESIAKLIDQMVYYVLNKSPKDSIEYQNINLAITRSVIRNDSNASRIWNEYDQLTSIANNRLNAGASIDPLLILAKIKLYNDYARPPHKQFFSEVILKAANTHLNSLTKNGINAKEHPFVKFHVTDYFNSEQLQTFDEDAIMMRQTEKIIHVDKQTLEEFKKTQTLVNNQSLSIELIAAKENVTVKHALMFTLLQNQLLNEDAFKKLNIEHPDKLQNEEQIKNTLFILEETFQDVLLNKAQNNSAIIFMMTDLLLQRDRRVVYLEQDIKNLENNPILKKSIPTNLGIKLEEEHIEQLLNYFANLDFSIAPLAAQTLFLDLIKFSLNHLPNLFNDETLKAAVITALEKGNIEDDDVKADTLASIHAAQSNNNSIFTLPTTILEAIEKLDTESDFEYLPKPTDISYIRFFLEQIKDGIQTKRNNQYIDLDLFKKPLTNPIHVFDTLLRSINYPDVMQARYKFTFMYYQNLLEGKYSFNTMSYNDLKDLIVMANPLEQHAQSFIGESLSKQAEQLITNFLQARMHNNHNQEINEYYLTLKDLWTRHRNKNADKDDQKAAFEAFKAKLQEGHKQSYEKLLTKQVSLGNVASQLTNKIHLSDVNFLLKQSVLTKLLITAEKKAEEKEYSSYLESIYLELEKCDPKKSDKPINQLEISEFNAAIAIHSEEKRVITSEHLKNALDALDNTSYIQHVSNFINSAQSCYELTARLEAMNKKAFSIFSGKSNREALETQILMHQLFIETSLEMILFKFNDLGHLNHLLKQHLGNELQNYCNKLITEFCESHFSKEPPAGNAIGHVVAAPIPVH